MPMAMSTAARPRAPKRRQLSGWSRPRRVAVGAAGAVVERRAVDDDELEALDGGGEEAGGDAEERGVVVEEAGVCPSFRITAG